MGILARTTQLTSGSWSRSFGGLCDAVSTGIERGSFCVLGVTEPGVEGGVNAGLTTVGGRRGSDPPLSRLNSETSLPVEGLGE